MSCDVLASVWPNSIFQVFELGAPDRFSRMQIQAGYETRVSVKPGLWTGLDSWTGLWTEIWTGFWTDMQFDDDHFQHSVALH